jgi:hypothetical protein
VGPDEDMNEPEALEFWLWKFTDEFCKRRRST